MKQHIIPAMLALGFAIPAWAGDAPGIQLVAGMKREPHHRGHMNHMKKGAFMMTKELDGYQVTFHVMKAPQGMQKGGSHHFMLKVEQDGKPETGLIVNSKVIHPGGQSESKMMMRMGDWYMASYDLGHPGKHQVMVLFKTPDGKKHFGGVYYDPRESQ